MKTIIAGSRGIENANITEAALQAQVKAGIVVTEVVSGTARGVDRAGEQWAELVGLPVKLFPADWAKFGKSAGAIRNRQMAKYADALIAIWDGVSRGTKNMIDIATDRGLKVHVYLINAASPSLQPVPAAAAQPAGTTHTSEHRQD